MNRNWLIGPSFAILALVGIAGCKKSPTQTMGTETNWLMACERDAQCAELSCLCGVCTTTCTADAQCGQANAVCGPLGSGAAENLCGGSDDPSSGGLCLRAGCTGADCVATEPGRSEGGGSGGGTGGTGGSSGSGGSGGTSGGTGGTSGPGGSTSGSGGETGGEGGVGGGSFSGMIYLDGTFDVSQAITDPETTGTEGACEGQSVAEVLQALHERYPEQSDIEQLYGAELVDSSTTNIVYAFTYEDRFRFILKRGQGNCVECQSGEYWYYQTDADCSPVEIAAAQYSQIFGETDACYRISGTTLWDFPEPPSADSLCTNGMCMVDGCRPEVCDTVGDRCCDPYPGDGPNYCNNELNCTEGTCTAPGATDEELLCVTSGGMWMPNSCGDYRCGLAPNCDAIIPGCNCGAFRNFWASGCALEDSCETTALRFSCGEEACGSVGEQYCEEHTYVDSPSDFACRDLPDSCRDTTECSCQQLVEAIPNAETCYGGTQGQFVVELEPEP